jgi:hypothetical protein
VATTSTSHSYSHCDDSFVAGCRFSNDYPPSSSWEKRSYSCTKILPNPKNKANTRRATKRHKRAATHEEIRLFQGRSPKSQKPKNPRKTTRTRSNGAVSFFRYIARAGAHTWIAGTFSPFISVLHARRVNLAVLVPHYYTKASVLWKRADTAGRLCSKYILPPF